MKCDYFDYKSTLLFMNYYCKQTGKELDTSTINTFCDNSLNYRNCPNFSKSSGGCYITTAMCEILGFEDDCEYLETLRGFRDTYMLDNPEYHPLLHDYNTVGPQIADKLYDDENGFLVSNALLNNFIKPAVEAINDNAYNAAINQYINMTVYLMDYYDLDKDQLSCYDSRKGIIRKREINNF